MTNNPTELANVLTHHLVESLNQRDWEDSQLQKAMNHRKAIVKQLAKLGELAVDSLIELLNHSDWAVRDDAAIVLGHIKSQRAIQPLFAIIENDENLNVKLSSALALERIGSPETLQSIAAWYRSNKISALKRFCVKMEEYMLYGKIFSPHSE